jgi:hypothetical protein
VDTVYCLSYIHAVHLELRAYFFMADLVHDAICTCGYKTESVEIQHDFLQCVKHHHQTNKSIVTGILIIYVTERNISLYFKIITI